jgi:hypothetical protein
VHFAAQTDLVSVFDHPALTKGMLVSYAFGTTNDGRAKATQVKIASCNRILQEWTFASDLGRYEPLV